MKLIIKAINRTDIDLRPFADIVGQGAINKIDASGKQPIAKYSDVVAQLLYNDEEIAYQHTYQTFYFELPMPLLAIIDSFPLPIVKTLENGTLTVNGLLTASLYVWRRFIIWCNAEDNEILKAIANYLQIQFSNINYFQQVNYDSRQVAKRPPSN